MLIPACRLILVNAAEATNGDVPTRRHRFTIAHELGHWICHAHQDVEEQQSTFCRSRDLSQDADRDLEREANVFGAELLMPEAAVREAWASARDAAEVAARFEVSALAAQWRLYSFGLIADAPAKSWSRPSEAASPGSAREVPAVDGENRAGDERGPV